MGSEKLEAEMVDDAVHSIDLEMMTSSEEEIKVWGYMMTQYNLKSGVRKLGKKGTMAGIKELMQLHVMDTWMVLDPSRQAVRTKCKHSSLSYFSRKNKQEK